MEKILCQEIRDGKVQKYEIHEQTLEGCFAIFKHLDGGEYKQEICDKEIEAQYNNWL